MERSNQKGKNNSTNVEIVNISRLQNKKYQIQMINIDQVDNKQISITRSISESQLGMNLKQVVEVLFSNKGSLVEPLFPLKGVVSYVEASMPSMGPKIHKLEVDLSTVIAVREALVSPETQIQDNSFKRKSSQYTFIEDILPVNIEDHVYIRGRVSHVVDGDTFHVEIGTTNGSFDTDPVKIRLIGVSTPEIRNPSGEETLRQEKLERNKRWLINNRLAVNDSNIEKAFKVGLEAKSFISNNFLNKEVVIIIDTYDGDGLDAYERYRGYAYFSNNSLNPNLDIISINKSLLANKSRILPSCALAEVEYSLDRRGTVSAIFPISTWWKYSINAEEKIERINETRNLRNLSVKEQFLLENNLTIDNRGVLVYNEERVLVSSERYTVKRGDTLSSIISRFKKENTYTTAEEILSANGLDSLSQHTSALSIKQMFEVNFVGKAINIPILRRADKNVTEDLHSSSVNDIPAESEEETYNGIHDDRDILDGITSIESKQTLIDSGFLRIGDCKFIIPPLSIKIDSVSSNRQVKTLRSKSSIQTQTGHSQKKISIQLYFSNKDQINGISYKNPVPYKDIPYYRNGLRPLIAQFKRAPFLPIENKLLNESYQIYSVALESIQIATVPGFPQCMQATLTLMEFDHISYMPQEEYFDGAFNWKLFRWYYQQAMQPNLLNRTYLKEVNVLDDSMKFFIVDELTLAQRTQAIKKLQNEIAPVVYEKANLERDDAELRKIISDGEEVADAQKDYKIFKNWALKHSSKDYPLFYKNRIFNPERLNEVKEHEIDKYESALMEYIDKLFNSGSRNERRTTSDIYRLSFIPNGMREIMDFLYENGETVNVQGFFLRRATTRVRSNLNVEGYNPTDIYGQVDHSGGIIIVSLESNSNKTLIRPISIKARNERSRSTPSLNYYVISPKQIALIEQIIELSKDAENEIINYKVEHESLNELANAPEGSLPMVEWSIPDDLHILGINSVMTNNYATLQLQDQECPTFQFMGSQDTKIIINMKTKSESTVRSLKDLASTTQRLARDYRIGIVSGILSVKNNILDLLGIKDFLIEYFGVVTSPNDKESFDITLVLNGFDKTQKLKETLDHAIIGQTNDQDSYNEYSKRRRTQDGFDYALIDFKLKQVEVYPDLELPTYEELNKDILYLGITNKDGSLYSHYPNPNNSKFVDPDFYIRAMDTSREYFARQLKEGMPALYMQDSLGFEGMEFGPAPDELEMSGPNVYFSDETMKWMNENLQTVFMGKERGGDPSKEDPLGTDKLYDQKKLKEETVSSNPHGNFTRNDARSARNYSIRATHNFVERSSPPRFNRENVLHKGPTSSQITRWFQLDRLENSRLINSEINSVRNSYFKNPEKAEVHNEIYSLVKKYFRNHPSEIEKIKRGEDGNTYLYGEDSISPPEITLEKITNVLKALFDLESGWKQFKKTSDGVVPINNQSDGNFAIGIAQINAPVNGILFNEDEVMRAAWDWKFCLEKGVAYFAAGFNIILNGRFQNHVKHNVLDYAIIRYNHPAANINEMSSPSDHRYYRNVLQRFKTKKYGVDPIYYYATPEKLVEKKLVSRADATNYLKQLRDRVVENELRKIIMSRPDTKNSPFSMGGIITPKADKMYGTVKVFLIRNKFDFFGTDSVPDGISLKYNEDLFKSIYSKSISYPVVIIDKNNQLKKAEAADSSLKNYYGIKNIGESVGVDALSSLIYGRLHSLLVKYNKTGTSKREDSLGITNKNKDFSPFDYSSKLVLVKEEAFAELAEATRLDLPLQDIRWENIYTLVNVDDIRSEDGSVSVRDIAVDLKIIEASAPMLQSPEKITEAFRTAFQDILDYDQRGRLLRAFPTFQMFIIDEGRWMSYHKLWDNFYGYNSIVSMDIIKDRRIAGQTAVIELSNVYGTLNAFDRDVNYGRWDYNLVDIIVGNAEDRKKVWDTLFNNPDEAILAARREQLDSLMLKPGARLHLRLGYGANAFNLPIVFNGVITEMNAEEIVTIVAQSDGIELTRKLQVQPDTTTDPGLFGGIKEPREMICEMLTSKGGFFKNLINNISRGTFFRNNPLGIVHFGTPMYPMRFKAPFDLSVGEETYGEAGINIYSGAGYNTFSQWIYTHGEKRGEDIAKKWVAGVIPYNPGDEPNIQIYLFDKTPWDVCQIYARVCPDYISDALPFEFRSTLFFGKPWWGVLDKYNYVYRWDDSLNKPVRDPVGGVRKSFSQFRFYSSMQDIISNGIIATEENMFTNVIGVYNEADGVKRTIPVQVDSDIVPEQQTTAIVHIPLQASGFATNFWTQEKYALSAAVSTLRDFVKEMYQGELVILGDPSAKPYDTFYLSDTHLEMNGNAQIKRVIHHFSSETGFLSTVTPDCISIIDDSQGISWHSWLASIGAGATGFFLGKKAMSTIWKSFALGPMGSLLKKGGTAAVDYLLKGLLSNALSKSIFSPTDDPRFLKIHATADKFSAFIKAIGKSKVNLERLDSSDIKLIKDMIKETKLAPTVTYTDEAITALAKNLRPIKKIYDASKTTTIFIDELWEQSGFLNKIDFFGKVEEKSLASAGKSLGNYVFRHTSKVVKTGTKIVAVPTAKLLRGASTLIRSAATRAIAFNIVATIGFAIITESLAERHERFLKSRQAVTILPLRYRGSNYIAGIKGHRGSVVGDSPSKIDEFLAGTGIGGGTISFLYNILGIDAPSYKPQIISEINKKIDNDI